MVLESLASPVSAERRPYVMMVYGFVYSSIAIFLSLVIFREQASMLMVFLTVLACVPLMYATMRVEERKDVVAKEGHWLLGDHKEALSFFMYLFLGFTVSFALWFIALPASTVQSLFSSQLATINMINSRVTGAAISLGLLSEIVSNNVRVLLFCVFFSFFYGAGAIFILTWNASVIAAAIGTFFRNNIAQYASAVGLVKVTGYFHIFSWSLLRYMTHGLLEIFAYFIGGLAGGLVSVAVLNHGVRSVAFRKVMLDVVNLMILALVITLIAGIVEVYVTPAIF